MTAYNGVSTRSAAEREESPQQRVVLRPAVDIYENGNAIHLVANLPGVGDEGLAVEIDGKTLTISGDIQIDMPAEMHSLHADVRATRYQRAFTLSDELDSQNIQASLADGVLRLEIPKREEVRPRRIEVNVG